MPNKSEIKPFKYVDLFAGIGGFAAAMEALGGEAVYSVDIDEKAAEVYRNNWGHKSLGDVTKDASEQVMNVPPHDVLLGGFPCQPFSKSGAQKGMEETRGTLYWNILQIVKAHHPQIVLLENVRNLTGPRHIHEWRTIVETLRAEGYTISFEPTIISPHLIPKWQGGRPQVRERVFIAGVYTGQAVDNAELISPLITREEIRKRADQISWELRKDLPLERNPPQSSALSKEEDLWITAWDAWVRTYREMNDTQPPGFPMWVSSWIPESKLDIPSGTPDWKKVFLKKNAELYTQNKQWIDTWLREYKVRDFPPSRQKFEWQAQDSNSIDGCLVQLRPSGLRVKKATYVPALVAINQTSIIWSGKTRRKLTSREAARLQGFPDWFDFGGQPDSATYKQLGNAVNVGAVWHAIKLLAKRDTGILKSTPTGRRLLKVISSAPESPDQILAKMRL